MNEQEINKVSAGPYEWAIIAEGPSQREFVNKMIDLGSGDLHAVWLPQHAQSVVGPDRLMPERAMIFCMTGNGSNSKNNAIALCCLLNQRELAIKERDHQKLPIPTSPEAVAWATYAIALEGYLGIADQIPESLKNWDPSTRRVEEQK